ncbi:MAG: hypothetical protein AB3N21_18885 [Ruegeria sp.]|uniref:hypothetical protein n=1 Tax=Ruegeria sp. TaxID=1879320 RepID=UPI00349E9883
MITSLLSSASFYQFVNNVPQNADISQLLDIGWHGAKLRPECGAKCRKIHGSLFSDDYGQIVLVRISTNIVAVGLEFGHISDSIKENFDVVELDFQLK